MIKTTTANHWGKPYTIYQLTLGSLHLDFYRLPAHNCVVCGTRATNCHYSMVGSLPWPVCDYHYKHTSPAFMQGVWDGPGSEHNRMAQMGLLDAQGEWVPMLFNQ